MARTSSYKMIKRLYCMVDCVVNVVSHMVQLARGEGEQMFSFICIDLTSFVLDLTLLKVEKPLTNLFLTATQIRVNTNKYNAIKRLHNQGFTSCFLVACLGRFQSSKIQIELSQHHQHLNPKPFEPPFRRPLSEKKDNILESINQSIGLHLLVDHLPLQRLH